MSDVKGRGEVLLINAYGSGAMYVDEILERGYACLLVFTLTGNEEVNGSFLERLVQKFAALYAERDFEVMKVDDDLDQLLKLVERRNIVAVCPGNDNGVALADQVAHELGLPGNDPATTYRRLTKTGMHGACRDAGLRYIRTAVVGDEQDVADFFRDYDLEQAFMKFDYGAGGVGVKLVDGPDEALRHYRDILSMRNSFEDAGVGVIMQEPIGGIEYVVNTLSCDGKHFLTDMWVYEKFDDGQGHILYNSMNLLSELDGTCMAIADYCLDVLTAIDFRFGVTHTEVKLDASGPVLMEVNPRPMGGGMTREYLKSVLGHCIVDLSLDSLLGNPWPENLYPAAMYRTPRFGKVKIGVMYDDMRGYIDGAHDIMRCLKTYKDCRYFQCSYVRLQLQNYSRTTNFENALYTIKLAADEERDLRYDFELLVELEEQFPDLMICRQENDVRAIDDAIGGLKRDGMAHFAERHPETLQRLPYGLEGLDFLRRVLRLLRD